MAQDDENNDDGGDDHQYDDNEEEDDKIILMDAELAPELYQTQSFYRQTRRRAGRIVKSVQECYLRDDLGFGSIYNNNVDNGDTRRTTTNTEVETIESVEALINIVLRNKKATKPKTDDDNDEAHDNAAAATPCLLVCDTNVLLHNLDVLERLASSSGGDDNDNDTLPTTMMLVIPQTALVECQHQQRVAYDRTIELIRSGAAIFFPDRHHVNTATTMMGGHNTTTTGTAAGAVVVVNDVNDARIRNVAVYLSQHLAGSNIPVILLTDDTASRTAFLLEQQQGKQQQRGGGGGGVVVTAHSVRSFVQQLNSPALSDLVAQFQHHGPTSGNNPADQDDHHFFTPHWSAPQMTRGIQSGRLHRGVFRRLGGNNHNAMMEESTTAVVMIRQGQDRVGVTIATGRDQNRAVDGDTVAIQLHAIDEWTTIHHHHHHNDDDESQRGAREVPSQTAVQATGDKNNDDETMAQIIAPDTAEPTLADVMNVRDVVTMDDATERRPTGQVVGIVRRNFGSHCGSIYSGTTTTTGPGRKKRHHAASTTMTSTRQQIIAAHERDHADGSSTCVFFPVDDRKVPPIIIRTTQRHRLLGQRIVVAMDSWPVDSPYPLGHYVRTIGPAGTKDVETDVLLQQHDIPHAPFAAAVLACLPSSDFTIACTSDRTDLRHLPILSIDPPGCKDIDDALHCVELDNGHWQVGVHIADVTHYVKPGSAIDLEAADRSTSTYLVNKRLDMLPGLLTTDLCSLKGNVDRYAFSVLWEVTPEADIVNVEFKKSVIHSIAALTYHQAQLLIDQPDDPDDIQGGAVKRLAKLARKFRKRRIDAGALTLASPEVKFVLDSESLNPTDVQSYALFEANAVVEEFMLLANVTVAKKILRHYPTLSILRRHPSPNRAMFDGLISKAKSRGFVIDIEDSKRLADSLDAAVDQADPYINKLLRILSTRCMSPAQYFCSGEFRPQEWHHYGLAAPVYTHFTSPIRRYADVCVHRLLAAAIGVAPLPPHLSSKTYLHDLAANMNRRHRAAQLAGRASVQLHTLIFFSEAGKQEEDAYVLDVDTTEGKVPSFAVMVPRYGIEVKVKLPVEADDPSIQRLPSEHKVMVQKSNYSRSIKVFDKVRVQITVVELENHHRELVVELLDEQASNPAPAPSSGEKRPRDNTAQAETSRPIKKGRP